MAESNRQLSQADAEPGEGSAGTGGGKEQHDWAELFVTKSLELLDQDLRATVVQRVEQHPDIWGRVFHKLAASFLGAMNRSASIKGMELVWPQFTKVMTGPDENLNRTTQLCAWCILVEAILSRSPEEASRLILSEDSPLIGMSLCNRIYTTPLLFNPLFPLYSIDELRCQTNNFIDFLKANRDSLVKTGLPTEPFSASPWLDISLGALYPTDPGIVAQQLLRIKRGHRPSPKSRLAVDLLSRLSLFQGCCENELMGCDCLNLDFLKALDAEEIKRIESDRQRFLEMTIQILTCLVSHLQKRDATDLWRTCLGCLTETLLADEADFYLGVDRKYAGADTKEPTSVNQFDLINPGGLTSLLNTITHFEIEIVVGSCAKMREALFGVNGDTPCSPRSYFDFLGTPHLPNVEAALDGQHEILSEAVIFYANARRRFIAALENEFEEWVEIRRKVKRRLASETKKVILASLNLLGKAENSPAPWSHVLPKQNIECKTVNVFPPIEGLGWEEVQITFLTNEDIRVSARKKVKRFNFAEIGFKDDRTGRPSRLWMLLIALAEESGKIACKEKIRQPVTQGGKKAFSSLRGHLKKIIPIEDDPFFNYRREKGYKVKFCLIDARPTSNQSRQQDADID